MAPKKSTPFGAFILTDVLMETGELKSVTLTLRSNGPVDLDALRGLLGHMLDAADHDGRLVITESK